MDVAQSPVLPRPGLAIVVAGTARPSRARRSPCSSLASSSVTPWCNATWAERCGGRGLGFFLAAVLLAGGSARARLLARRTSGLRAVRTLGITAALARSVLLIPGGDFANAPSITPVRDLAITAAHGLPAGAPIHVVEMNHRITQNLATGRRTVFLRANAGRARTRARDPGPRRRRSDDHRRCLAGGASTAGGWKGDRP